MDVSQFMGGSWLRHNDLPAPSQVWTIRAVSQQQVGTDLKIVVNFKGSEGQTRFTCFAQLIIGEQGQKRGSGTFSAANGVKQAMQLP